ncbi:MAG: MOSC domain-containing protein [bacterium]
MATRDQNFRGRIEAVCTSERRGEVKRAVAAGILQPDHGLEGDGHAGPGHRQVSILATLSIARIKAVIPELGHGAFAENLVVSGLDLSGVQVGDRLAVGGTAVLEVTQIGKECHNACVIREKTGDCVMPREGLFCRVIAGGPVTAGDSVVLTYGREIPS